MGLDDSIPIYSSPRGYFPEGGTKVDGTFSCYRVHLTLYQLNAQCVNDESFWHLSLCCKYLCAMCQIITHTNYMVSNYGIPRITSTTATDLCGTPANRPGPVQKSSFLILVLPVIELGTFSFSAHGANRSDIIMLMYQ